MGALHFLLLRQQEGNNHKGLQTVNFLTDSLQPLVAVSKSLQTYYNAMPC